MKRVNFGGWKEFRHGIGCVLLVCSCGAPEGDEVERDGIGLVTSSIINGDPSSHEFVVHVLSGTGFCTGTMLRNDVVLTARHCTETTVENLQVRSENGQNRAVSEVAIHPDMLGENMDVALLRLSEPLPVDGRVVGHSQLLHRTDSNPLVEQDVHCIGYGFNTCEGGGGVQREGFSVVSDLGPWRDLVLAPGPEGHIPHTGDSGGSCFTDAGRITHVNRETLCNVWAAGVRAEAMGPWVDRVVASWSYFVFEASGAVLQVAAVD